MGVSIKGVNHPVTSPIEVQKRQERRIIMSIKILIERKFKEAATEANLKVIEDIRIKALRQRGYIGGETRVNVDDNLMIHG